MQNKFLFIIATIFINNAFADSISSKVSGVSSSTEARYVADCVKQAGEDSAFACIGVKSFYDAKYVASCVRELGPKASRACVGIGNSYYNAKYVVKCVKLVGDEFAELCVGVESSYAADAIKECLDLVGPKAAIACGELPL